MSLFKNVGIGSDVYREMQFKKWMKENTPDCLRLQPIKNINGRKVTSYSHVNKNICLKIIPDYITFDNTILWVGSASYGTDLDTDFRNIVKFYFDKYQPGARWGDITIKKEEIKKDYPKLFQVFPDVILINAPDYSLRIL